LDASSNAYFNNRPLASTTILLEVDPSSLPRLYFGKRKGRQVISFVQVCGRLQSKNIR
jgi:hypothetical protein